VSDFTRRKDRNFGEKTPLIFAVMSRLVNSIKQKFVDCVRAFLLMSFGVFALKNSL